MLADNNKPAGMRKQKRDDARTKETRKKEYLEKIMLECILVLVFAPYIIDE